MGKQVGRGAATVCQGGTPFEVQNQPSKALYAQVSQLPPNESVSIPNTTLQLTDDL